MPLELLAPCTLWNEMESLGSDSTAIDQVLPEDWGRLPRYTRGVLAMERIRDRERGQDPRGGASGDGGDSAGARDLCLVRKVLEGDSLATSRLADRLQCLSRMLRFQSSRLRFPLRDNDLHDLAQETALALWRKLDQFDGRASLETWAYRFSGLQLMVFLRRTRRREHAVENLDALAVDGLGEQAWVPEDPTVDLEHALLILEPEELEVVRAKHYSGLTFEAIGVQTGLSPNTAKTRYYRALLKLREHLQGRYPELFGTHKRGQER